MVMPRVTIIGGGLCGATVARLLSSHVQTTVLEKSGRPSGRVASLLFRDTLIDHGAPCFTLSVTSRALLGDLVAKEMLPVPGRVVNVHASGEEVVDEQSFFFMRGSANTLGSLLLADLPNVDLRTRTLAARDSESGKIHANDGPLPLADATVVTAPLPQACALYPGLLDPASCGKAFAPALMAAVAYPLGTAADDGVYARRWHDGASATRESLKARGAREDLFLVRGTEAFSRACMNDKPADWAGALRALLEALWPGLAGAPARATFPKRWRYAEVSPQFRASPEGAAVHRNASAAAATHRVFFAGDALGAGAGVDAALASGAATAASVSALLGLPAPRPSFAPRTAE